MIMGTPKSSSRKFAGGFLADTMTRRTTNNSPDVIKEKMSRGDNGVGRKSPVNDRSSGLVVLGGRARFGQAEEKRNW